MVLALVVSASTAQAQAITSWTLSTYTVTSIGPPLVLSATPVVPPTVIPLAAATCNQPAPPTNNVNPNSAVWLDVNNAGKVCIWKDPGTGSILGVPFSSTTTYASTLTATDSAGTSTVSAAALFSKPGLVPAAPLGLVITQ